MASVQGKTVLITGASSGIGRALALRLAQEGAALVLVARSEAPLRALAAQLEAGGAARPIVVVQDLSQPGAGAQLHAHLRALRISVDVLVNNAGFGSYGPFEALDAVAEQQQIAVNVGAVVDLCHAFLPDMLQRQSGAVLNIASTAAFQPAPYMATYAATKAFVLSFSEALWAECRNRGVQVTALCPGAVETAFIDKLGNPAARRTAVFARTLPVEQVTSAALKALHGTAPSRIVGLRNWLMANSLRLAPRAAVAGIAARMLKPSAHGDPQAKDLSPR